MIYKMAKCKAIGKSGRRCSNEAIMGDYCVTHYRISTDTNKCEGERERYYQPVKPAFTPL